MKTLGKLLRGAVLALLGLVLLLELWQLAAGALLGREPPFVLGYAQLTVLSGSMEPAFSAGDMVVIRREEAYRVGDVVSFRDQGGLTTHRIVGEGAGGFVTKGDGNNAADPEPVPAGQIAGRVVLVLPRLGRLALFLRTPAGVLAFLALGLPALYLPDWLGRLRGKGERGAE